MKQYRRKIPAGELSIFNVDGDYFRVESPSAADITVRARNNRMQEIDEGSDLGAGDECRFSQQFNRLEITNNSASEVDLIFKAGSGDFTSDTVTGSVTVDAHSSATGGAQKTVNASATTIAANSNRKQLILHADPSNSNVIWVGATAANTGIPLAAGGSLTLPISGALDLYGGAASQLLNYIEIE